MRLLKHALLAASLAGFSSAAHAAVTFNSVDFSYAAPAGASAVIDFENDRTLPTGFQLTGGTVRNLDDGQGAQPATALNTKATSYYLAANPGNTATITSLTGYREVSLYWGSIDKYNTLTLLDKNGGVIESYTGDEIFMPADGNQFGAATNRRVTFQTSGSTSAIYGLRFESTSPAFETDNIAFSAAVPEPAAWAMMLMGFGLVGGALRRSSKQSKGVRAFA